MEAAAVGELRLVCDGTSLSLAPLQGYWTQAQYLRLTDHACALLEFTDGRIEVLPMPTDSHQTISLFLLSALLAFTTGAGAVVRYAPLRLRIRDGKFREPDLLLLLDAKDPRRQNDYWHGADLVIEVVSPSDPRRDTHEKRADYAEALVPEYWIVDPRDETVTVLALDGDAYCVYGVFRRGQSANSRLLAGFSVAVSEVFDAT